MSQMYNVLLFSYIAQPEASDSERESDFSEADGDEETTAERQLILDSMMVRKQPVHGRSRQGVKLLATKGRGEKPRVVRLKTAGNLDRLRHLVPGLGSSDFEFLTGVEVLGRVEVHSVLRTRVAEVTSYLAAGGSLARKLYTAAFCRVPWRALSPDIRLKHNAPATGFNKCPIERQPVVGLDTFWYPTATGSRCLLARVRVYVIEVDPTYGIQTLDLAVYNLDWVHASALGETVALGPGNGGYPGGGDGRWSVLSLPGSYAVS